MRWFLLSCALALAACIQSGLVPCGDQLCPKGDMCISGVCASADQLATCSGQPDDTACTLTSGSVGRCANGICIVGGCGNDRVDPGEVCDDGNIKAGDGCSGTCDSNESCGNGVLDVVTGESCDCGSDAAHMPASCTAPNSDDPSSACTTTCKLRRCGDGEVAGPEQCDGPGTVSVGCDRFGYYTGEVTCSSLCQLDPSGCSERCGDKIVQSAYEVCDTLPPANQTCLDFGFDLGWLGCTSVCTPALADCDRFGWARVHPRVFAATDVIARANRVLIRFSDGAVALLVNDIENDPTITALAIASTDTRSYAVSATEVLAQEASGSWKPISMAPPPWTAAPAAAFASDSGFGLFVAVPGDQNVHRWDGTQWVPCALPGAVLQNPRFGGSRALPLLYDAVALKAYVWNGNSFDAISPLPTGASTVRDVASTATALYMATEDGVFMTSSNGSPWTPLQGATGRRLVSNTLGGIDMLTDSNTIVRIGNGALGFDAPPGTTSIAEAGGAMYVAGPAGGVFGVLKGAWQLLPQPAGSTSPEAYAHIHGGDPVKGEILVAGTTTSAAFVPGQSTWMPLPTTAGTRDVVHTPTTTAWVLSGEFDYAFGTVTSVYPLSTVAPQMLFHAASSSDYYAAGGFGVAIYHDLTSSLEQRDTTPYQLFAIDGTSNDVYAVGRDVANGTGVIVHLNNNTGWSTVATTGITMGPLNDIYISPSGTIFTISDNQIYYGTPGTTWTSRDLPGAGLHGISGTSDTDIFVAGSTTFGFSFSGLAHFDGTNLYPLRLPASGTPRDLYVTRGAVYMLLTDTTSNTDSVWSLVRATAW